MKPIKNILVGLDLSEMDEVIIRYTSYLSDQLGAEHVVFVHNIKKYEVSDLFKEQLKGVELDEMISEELDELVAQHFKAKAEAEVLISEDPYTESLINYVVQRNYIDLVVVGNKNSHVGSGIIPDKLLRMVKCDILSVPREAAYSMATVFAGTDFSSESKKTFELARYLQDHVGSKVIAGHVYNVPIQFSPYLDKEEMVPKIEKHVKEKFDKFLKRIDMPDLETRIVRGRNTRVAQKIVEETVKANADILLVADKGGNIFSSLLIGSVTDELFRSVLEIPLWVVK
ncbi:universal stress protein [Robertkochia marina]|uniref:Universal stress protein n=1 Tax=Robertkochia marina TaxID=1227945 RepID=A0A4S3M2B8_9FLAO|nr:universal stress protein [Robertkochia marina]THD69264.1 universal stress protein [Robertkochia marina]TRZ47478.1 universal stress protein [Robertkochia marina]